MPSVTTCIVLIRGHGTKSKLDGEGQIQDDQTHMWYMKKQSKEIDIILKTIHKFL